MSQALLRISGLNSRYGGVVALQDVALEVHPGELVAIIGANGAGKTTLLKSILGLVDRDAKVLEFDGRSVARMSALELVRLGVALVPEGRQVFGAMTVEENLAMGGYLKRKDSAGRSDRKGFVYALFPVLERRARQLAETLSGGEQQMLAVGRALMGDPRLLLVDELSLGLAPIVVHELYRQLLKLHREGLTMVVVEQNARLALSTSDRAYVLSTGSVVVHGRAADLMQDESVRRAYLG